MAENKKEDATEKVVEQKKEDNVVKVNIDKPTINKEDNIIKVDLTKKPEETNETKKETTENTTSAKKEIYGYPTKHIPHNAVLDVKHKIPLYTKSINSNNMYAAGYYIVHFPKGWVKGFCPKLSTITQNQFQGPFKTVMEQRQAFSNVNKNR